MKIFNFKTNPHTEKINNALDILEIEGRKRIGPLSRCNPRDREYFKENDVVIQQLERAAKIYAELSE